MALIDCPAPGCSEQVVDNWLTCPRCKCPIQVLRQAQAAAEPPPAEGEDAAAVDEMREQLPEQEDQEYEFDLPPEKKPVEDLEMKDRLHLVGKGAIGLGVGFGLGVPLLLGSPGLATFCGIAAIALLGAGWGIQKLARRPSGP